MNIVTEANGFVADQPASAASAGAACPAQRISVLLVDDDDDFREAAEIELGHMGFDVVALPGGDEMVEFVVAGNRCDAIVLDWKLPRRLGVEYLATLRRHNVTTPVIILTGVPEAAYENAALDQGAYDFVDKARGLCILAKRVRRIVTSLGSPPEPAPTADIRSGRLLLRPAVSRALWDGADLNLTVTEFNIVRLMVTHANEHVSYRAIYDCVHHPGFIAGSGEDGYRTNVRSAVKRIRNKFRAVDPDFAQIENFSAFGYRWHGEEPDPTSRGYRPNGHGGGIQFAADAGSDG